MSEKQIKCNRLKLFGVTVGVIVVLMIAFIGNPSTRNYCSFFGYASLTMFITMLIADVWLKETSMEAFDMPAFHLKDSPINVAIQPCFTICFIIFCILKAVAIIIK